MDQWPALNERLLEQARLMPGTRTAAVSQMTAMGGGARTTSGVAIEGRPIRQGAEGELREDFVGPAYFETLGMPLTRGRGFRAQDTAKTPKVAIVNETMARKFFGDADPIGKHFGYEMPPDVEIVGVVRDARIDGLRQRVPAIAYRLMNQYPIQLASTLYVRVAGSAADAKASLVQAVAAAEPELAVREVVTVAELAERTVARERLVSQLTGTFGLLAVGVACLGLYATVWYSVAQRRNEIGVRLALGASPGSVRWLVLRETLSAHRHGSRGRPGPRHPQLYVPEHTALRPLSTRSHHARRGRARAVRSRRRRRPCAGLARLARRSCHGAARRVGAVPSVEQHGGSR